MRFLLSFCVLWAGACSGDDAPTDAGSRRDVIMECDPGEHLCGIVCMPDMGNDVRNGCRLGCGAPCPEPTGGEARCLSSGTCGVTCNPPFVTSGDGCRCQPVSCSSMSVMCGMIDNGCGSMTNCGDCGMGRECIDGACTCALDDAEPNDEDIRAFALGTFPDEPDTAMTFSEFNAHSNMDVDFYRARVVDAAMSNPTVRVTLLEVPSGHVYDLAAWFTCDRGGDAIRCDSGMVETSFGMGCTETSAMGMARVQLQTFCATTDETGQLLIRVTPTTWTNACMAYQLIVEVT